MKVKALLLAGVLGLTTLSYITPKAQTVYANSESYQLNNKVGGYYTSLDAKAGVNKKVTMFPGNYIILKTANGMVNITKTPNLPGAWINPAENGTATTITDYDLIIPDCTVKYMNSLDAAKKINSVGVYKTGGKVWIYKKAVNGMINLTFIKYRTANYLRVLFSNYLPLFFLYFHNF